MAGGTAAPKEWQMFVGFFYADTDIQLLTFKQGGHFWERKLCTFQSFILLEYMLLTLPFDFYRKAKKFIFHEK